MKTPVPDKRSKPAAEKSGATLAKVAVIGASAGFVTARLLDFALVGTGVAAAVGSVGFAGMMLLQGEHRPLVNGMQYLAIFSQPSVGSKAAETSAWSYPPPPEAAQSAEAPPPPVDTTPVGAIEPAPKSGAADFELVAAGRDHAWVRMGARILSIHPGDTIPDLGKVGAIAWQDGRWALIGEDGRPMLLAPAIDAREAAAKPLIVGRQAPQP